MDFSRAIAPRDACFPTFQRTSISLLPRGHQMLLLTAGASRTLAFHPSLVWFDGDKFGLACFSFMVTEKNSA
jgi:hypothetical protein